MTRRTAILAGAALAGATLAGCLGRSPPAGGSVTDLVRTSFAAHRVREVRVENQVGDVTIAAIGTGDVDVEVLKRSVSGQAGLEDIIVGTELVDGVLTVTTDIGAQDTVRSKAGPTTAVTITVPAGRSGPTVDAIEVGVGTVALFDTRGDTRIRTGVGDVTAAGADGYLDVHTQIGTVLLSDVSGLDGVRTEVGDIKADLLGLRSDVVIGTDIGSVTVGVADDLDLDVLAETGGGFDANLPLTDERVRFGQFTGRQNAGGHRLQVSSELGTVSLRSIGRDERGVTAS